MNLSDEQEIKKEFQLERVILFSDAIFAIIITIMVIELKLPETIREATNLELSHEFKRLVLKLMGYTISFFLVAMFWMRHVKIFSFLKDYNRNVLVLNLVFLFTVSLFPFAVTLITGIFKPGTPYYNSGMTFYFGLLLAVNFAQTLLSSYLIKHKATLCFANDEIEDELQWKVLKWNKIIAPVLLALLIASVYFGLSYMYSFGIMALYGIGTGRLIRAYYPGPKKNKPFLNQIFNRKKKLRKVQAPSEHENVG
jgi:uncharacterized membrane protein